MSLKSRFLQRVRRRRRFKDEMDYISSVIGENSVIKASEGLIELLERKHHIRRVYAGEFANLYKVIRTDDYYMLIKSK